MSFRLRPPGRWLCAALPAACVLAGCTGTATSRDTVVRDSAGIRIIDHGPVDFAALPQWSVADTPRLLIGTVAGDENVQFHRIRDAIRTTDGAIVVLDDSRTVRGFAPDGSHLWTAGGPGEGPGEFRFPSMVAEIAVDSLVVWDASNRLSIFTSDGRFARDAVVALDGPSVAWGRSGPREVLIDARRAERTQIDGHQALVATSDHLLVDMDGTVTRDLGSRTYGVNFQEVAAGGAFSPAIFATSAVFGPGPAGVWYGDTESYELREFTGADSIARIIRWEGPDRSVREQDYGDAIAKWSEDSDDPAVRRFLIEYGNTHPRSSTFPAFEQLLVDRVGRVWLRDYVKPHLEEGQRRWLILSPDGARIVARLTHPANLSPMDAGEDWLLAVRRDAMDVEWIALYDFVESGQEERPASAANSP
jgi:hypothetical protein